MYERLKQIRESKKMSQAEFAKLLGMGQSTLGMMEVGKREILDRHIKTICSILDVNEEWFRTGVGEMFNNHEMFSLDKYAEANQLTDLECDIIRGYMELDKDTRKKVMDHFKAIFKKHLEGELAADMEINAEVESYRQELEAEKKEKTLQASHDTGEGTN